MNADCSFDLLRQQCLVLSVNASQIANLPAVPEIAYCINTAVLLSRNSLHEELHLLWKTHSNICFDGPYGKPS